MGRAHGWTLLQRVSSSVVAPAAGRDFDINVRADSPTLSRVSCSGAGAYSGPWITAGEYSRDAMGVPFHPFGTRLSHDARRAVPGVSEQENDARRKIDGLLQSVQNDRARSNSLFQYLWTVMCVDRGLLRVVEERSQGDEFLIVEEAGTGRRRRVPRPCQLDAYTEGLAVQALSRLIEVNRQRA